MSKRRGTGEPTRIVSLGEVVICDFKNPEGIKKLETGNVQSCIALVMYNAKKGIAVLGHFDSPANMEGIMEKIAEQIQAMGGARGFSVELVGGIISTGFTAKFINTDSVSNPIIAKLHELGIEPTYQHYGTSMQDDTNFCVSVGNRNGISVLDDRDLQHTKELFTQLSQQQVVALGQRMEQDPRKSNLGYQLDVYEKGKSMESTYVQMDTREHIQWKNNQKNPSICPCVII